MSVTPARGRQLSLFGVEAHPPTPLDLEGLLAGAGQVGRMGGTGRVSIVVEGAWRCAVLRAECELRGLAMSCEPTGEDDRWLVRTAYSAALAPLAARWLDEEGVKQTPAGLALEGRRLRLWVAAAGVYDGQRAYLLRLAPRRIPDPEPDPAPENDTGAEPSETGETGEPGEATGPTAGSSRKKTLVNAMAVANVDTEVGASTRGATGPAAGAPTAPAEAPDTPAEALDTLAEALVEAPALAFSETVPGRAPSMPRDRRSDRSRARPAAEETGRKRGRKGESKITAFDPGPDEFADADPFIGPDEFPEPEDFVDDGRDEWPDSGVGDLPTVVLDPVSAPVEPEAEMPEDGTGRTNEVEDAIDRRVVDNWVAVGDALIAVGLPVVFIAPDAGGPAYRIVGLRRITRLAELVGEPPAGAAAEDWPR